MKMAALSVVHSVAASRMSMHMMLKILGLVTLYNFVCVLLFTAVYSSIDFSKHFSLAPGVHDSIGTRMYYAFLTQSQCMSAGDVTPITPLAHALLSTQVIFSWFLMLMFVIALPFLIAKKVR